MPKSLKVVLIHNVVAPYRIPLFDELAMRCDLTVFFCKRTANDRKWETKITGNRFHHVFLKHIGRWPFVYNISLPIHLGRNPADVYIIIDNEANIFSNLLTILYAKIRQKPYVLWSGHLEPSEARIPPVEFHKSIAHCWPIKQLYLAVIRFLNQILYKHATSFLAYSDMSKEYLMKHGVDKKKIIVGTQAMSASLMPNPMKRLSLEPKKIHLLYLGYLRPEKGIDVLVQAVLKTKNQNIELHIVGDGPQKIAIQKMIVGKSNVHFYPYVDAQERAQWYSSVDATVLPTFWDPWAHTVTESLYYGTPAIVSLSAAASSVIENGKNGFIFEAGRVSELAGILDDLTTKKIVTMRRIMKTADKRRLYDVSADADNFMQAITSVKGTKS